MTRPILMYVAMTGAWLASQERVWPQTTKTWIAASDNWRTKENWSPASVPNTSDDAEISNGGTAILNLPGILNGGGANQLYLGRNASTSGGLSVLNGAILTTNDAFIGDAGTGTALVSSPSSLWQPRELKIGNAGTGTLNIYDSGTVRNRSGAIGVQTGSTGTVRVNGTGSVWDNWSTGVDVGLNGTGHLIVELGGRVQGTGARIGTNAGSHGDAIVDGATWSTQNFKVGAAGEGVLTVSNGGTVNTFTGYIGELANSIGQATVKGANSAWTPISLYIGHGGNGTLNIQDFGRVTASVGVTVGVLGGSVGVANVSASSTLTLNSSLYVGDAGNGTMNITGGGTVDNLSTFLTIIGDDSGSSGTVLVSGPGSKLKHRDWLHVGHYGTGRIIMNGGGVVENVNNEDVVLGRYAGSFGTVEVGSGSIWTNNVPVSGFTIGYEGHGTLDISGGSEVRNISAVVGKNAGSYGVVSLDAGSTWTNTGTLYIGEGGTGDLLVNGGGIVNSPTSYLGYESGSAGTAIIDGKFGANFPSKWVNSGILIVGYSGTGTLTVSQGGTVENTTAYLGYENGASGTANVSGGSSLWKSTGTLYVGYRGTATMNISGGGEVQNATAYIALENGPSVVNVDGKDAAGTPSKWTNNGDLSVGYEFQGTLNVTGGGMVQNANAYVGRFSGATGNAKVEGAGSKWVNTGELHIGEGGPGTVNVLAGGSVTSARGYIDDATGASVVTVDGKDAAGMPSKWSSGSELYVGYFDKGILNITGEARVESTLANVARFSGSEGTVTVGAGSTWKNTGELNVGRSGVGTLHVNGGTVESASAFIGRSSAAATGTVNLSAGSTWTNTGNLNVGGTGNGVLDLKDGGTLTVGGTMTIAAKGTLRGRGKIVATQAFNSGTIALDANRLTWPGNVENRTDITEYKANLLIQGNFAQNAGGHLSITGLNQTHALQPGSTHSTAMVVSGIATLDGKLSVGFQPGYLPDIGSRFGIIAANQISGKIANFDSAVLPNANDRFLGLNYRRNSSGLDPVLEVITLKAPERLAGTASNRNLLFVTHGTNSEAETWVKPLAQTMASAPSAQNLGTWQVVAFDWRYFSAGGEDNFKNVSIFDPWLAGTNAINIGESVVRWYKATGQSFDNMHLMAHSAGTWMVDAMADAWTSDTSSAENIHLTLFEAYTPATGVSRQDNLPLVMADQADFAEHYFHRHAQVPDTDTIFPTAVNIDLSQLDRSLDIIESHAYPYASYHGAAAAQNPRDPNYGGFGPQLSQLFSGTFPTYTSQMGKGNLFTFAVPQGQRVRSMFDPINMYDQTNVTTGNVQVLPNGNSILRTQSPAILTSLIDLDQPFWAFQFDFEFLSENPGLLSVYFDSEQVYSFENGPFGAGPGDVFNSGWIWLGDEHAAGSYSVTFRIDPLGIEQAAIQLSNLQFISLALDPAGPGGDFDGNGTVDAGDYVLWRKNPTGYGGQAGYDTWRANFGRTSGGGSGEISGANVPEPPSLVVLTLVASGAVLFGRRSWSRRK